MNWKLPTSDTPGFLKRRRELTAILDMGIGVVQDEQLIDFLEPFVETKKGISKRNQIIEDMSQEDYSDMILVIMGYKTTVSDPKGESSVPA